ncbi:hypothetical protein SSX86_026303 [Deinandra increscens subsp. villosa]|uniref:Glycosyltransferase n=1 Tax=Deinandra increscens subsp. villosa TaxID=3103831 RepID=A0AAP0CFP1_9ASTR
MEIGRKRHVGVFTFPFASHPSLLLTVVRRLASTAPTVVFSFFTTRKFNRALFANGGSDNILPYDISDGLPKDFVVGKQHEDINFFLPVAEEEFKKGVQAAEKDVGMKISCLVVDAFLWFSGDVAEEMNIPWVAFWTAGACSLSAHFYTDLLRQKYGSSGPNDEIANLIPGLSTVRLGDIPSGIITGDLESPFATMPHKMAGSITRATAVLINSFQELDADMTKNLSSIFKNFLNIGPFNLISKQPSKLDESSCIPCLPPGFLERTTSNGLGKVVSWAPQVQVLEHLAIGVFATHSGWNSLLESIAAGVPMICRPFYGDQPLNSWMIERVWGIGVRIEGGKFTKDGTCSALELVLSSSSSLSKGLKERIEGLKDLAHKAVGSNGSSMQNFKTLVDVVTGATL